MCGLCISAHAQFHKSTDSRVNHFLTLSLAGGENNLFFSVQEDAPRLKTMPGADAVVAFTYEMRKGWFIVGFGAQADYDFTWQKVDDFSHSFDRYDRENEDVLYAYHYSEYKDRQHNLQVSVPLYLGANIGDLIYVLAGAKLSLAMLSMHDTHALLSTDGTYARFFHTIQNAPTYGYYATDTYSFKGEYDPSDLKISPTLEFGFRIPVESKSGRVGMRLGLYAEYGIPLSWNNKFDLVDYSRVDKNPVTQTQSQLRSSIIFNAPVNASFQTKAYSQLSVGLRWTVLFNVTPPEHICMCSADF